MHWVLTRAYNFPSVVVVDRLAALLMSDEIRAEDATAVRTAVAASRKGADFADALIASAVDRAGCDPVVTFDHRAAVKLGWRLV